MEVTMSSHRLITRSLSTGLAVAALAAPAALAGPPLDPIIPITPQEQQVLASRGQGAPEPVQAPVVTKAKPVDNSGFDVGDAGVGAGVAAGLMLLALGSAGLARKRTVGVAH
jgi:hypothetical protein